MTDPEMQANVDAWKTTIGVQQHFNDIEMKIRNYAITVLVALLGAAAVALREGARVEFLELETSLATLLVGAALIAWWAFYFMDHNWYHQLLRGAVSHGRELEEKLESRVAGIGLTNAISEASPYRFLWMFTVHSKHKIRLFYGIVGVLLVALMVIAHFSGAAEGVAQSAIATTADGATVCGDFAGESDSWLVVGGDAYAVDELTRVSPIDSCS